MIKLSEAIAKRVKDLLKEQNMTQYQLYIKSGVPQTTISAIVRNLHERPYVTVIYDIAQGFGVSLSEFFNSSVFDEIE